MFFFAKHAFFDAMKKVAVILAVLSIAWACSEQSTKEEVKAPESAETKPATSGSLQRSELALLMRNMQNRLERVSDSIEQGYTVNTRFLNDFKHMKTAEPSPTMKIDDFYHGMAETFLNNYEQFESDTLDQRTHFNNAIETCLACHQQKCTGPLKVIGRLKVPEKTP